MLSDDLNSYVRRIFEHRLERTSRRNTARNHGGSVLYVASHCLPHHSNGYAFRTQEILRAAHARGDKVRALTRPGYPWDRNSRPSSDPHGLTSVDGIRYHHIRSLGRHWPLLIYAPLAAKKISGFARDNDIGLIHAASNHVNALPALLAAKELGIPFHYEMRGVWEFSKAAAHPDFERSRQFKRGLALERLVAQRAGKVFAISEQISRYAQENLGIPADRISLLPNCVAAEFSNRAPAEPMEPATIAYAGSLNYYEGLDLLLVALAKLRSQGVRCPLKIAGDGPARRTLQRLAEDLQLTGSVSFLGSVPRHEALEVVARSSVVCLPRKPHRVCELVPPLKLVEAMAMGKPVIVPDLPVFRDELGNGSTGLFFRAGSSESLAEVLDLALSQPDKLSEIGRVARDHIARSRIWSHCLPELWRNPANRSARPAHA